MMPQPPFVFLKSQLKKFIRVKSPFFAERDIQDSRPHTTFILD